MTNTTALEFVTSGQAYKDIETKVEGIKTLHEVYNLNNSATVIDIIADVVSSESDEDHEDQHLTNILNKQPVEFYDKLSTAIIGDDYIMPDWLSVTDFHDYAQWTVELAQELVKISACK